MIYDVLYETLIGAKRFGILFHKEDGFIRDYDGTKYVVLFGLEKYDAIYDRIRYLIVLQYYSKAVLLRLLFKNQNQFRC